MKLSSGMKSVLEEFARTGTVRIARGVRNNARRNSMTGLRRRELVEELQHGDVGVWTYRLTPQGRAELSRLGLAFASGLAIDR